MEDIRYELDFIEETGEFEVIIDDEYSIYLMLIEQCIGIDLDRQSLMLINLSKKSLVEEIQSFVNLSKPAAIEITEKFFTEIDKENV